MRRKLFLLAIALTTAMTVNGQKKIIIDGDEIILRDSLDGKVTLLTSIKRVGQNQNAIWIKYDRRPGVDPWIKKPIDGLEKYSDENFIRYLKENGIHVFGSITTYDNCLCSKNKTMASPDMYLIYFKIDIEQWAKLKEFYPEMAYYSYILKYQN